MSIFSIKKGREGNLQIWNKCEDGFSEGQVGIGEVGEESLMHTLDCQKFSREQHIQLRLAQHFFPICGLPQRLEIHLFVMVEVSECESV